LVCRWDAAGGRHPDRNHLLLAWFGRWLIDALQRRDYPVVQGGVLVATMIILVNLLVDLLYGVVNPRIRHKK
jgi:ABC-type dipeptide/oligopeptide/nickel transport system permease component